MRLPRPLYRRGWGRLLGHTFLLITHQGRRTGKRRETVAMALTYDPATRKTVVCSAWGPKSEWLRNLRARPALQIRIGRERYVPEQRFLSEDEAVAVATEFRERHPWRLRLFATILGWGDLRGEAAVREFVRSRPFVAFAPAHGSPADRAASPWQRLFAVTGLGASSGLAIGLVMPRGPVTSGQALTLLVVSVLVGMVAGFVLRSRWAMLIAPVAQIVVFEVTRLGAAGPTVDGISFDGTFGPLAFLVGRGFYGLVGTLPLVVAAAYGAGLARRADAHPSRGIPSRIGLYLRRGLAAVAALGVLGLVYLLVTPASVPPIRDASGKVVPGSIASLEKVRINGSDQWIEIRAWSPGKPVLLTVPGGPGQSDLAMSRPTLGTLAKDFVVVSWDQRGIGKSYASFDPSKLTTRQAVADTVAMTNYLRKRFGERKIYLFGESGGSVIGVLAVQQHPELYHAWIGSGQMVDPLQTDRLIYHGLLVYAAEHHDNGLASKLRGYGPPPYRSVYAYGYVMSQYDKLAGDYTEPKTYTDALDKAGVGPAGVLGGEYTLPERMNVVRGLIDTFSVMYPQWRSIDFRRSAEHLEVPVYIFTGRHELAARRDLALAWFQRLHAPVKRLYDYPDAGHATAYEHFQDLHRIMVETVLPAAYSN
jgi:deazaflavin-dependent oxidoreductase (nitroreductase family)